jgi:hypothetical protein
MQMKLTRKKLVKRVVFQQQQHLKPFIKLTIVNKVQIKILIYKMIPQ